MGFSYPLPALDRCVYDKKNVHEVDHYCSVCGAGLCSSCGFTLEGIQYCNECYEEELEQRDGACRLCGLELAPIRENNGFTMPNGQEHWEIVGYKVCPCKE